MKGFFKSRLILTGVAMVLLVGALAVALVSNAHSHTARAYGKANWQAAFSGTATVPGSGGFGFWGWCDFGGGVTSGNTGDCEMSQYFHTPGGGGLTCEVSIDVTSWDARQFQNPYVSFVIEAGTITVHPSSQTQNCSFGFPADTGIPAAAGHYNLTSSFLAFAPPGARGSLQIQVTQIPS
jgi:hypothetical protein